ncbi:hypothetical protein HH303_13980 [Rhodospirillaceae bacterium KN72]|uniref:phosphoribosylglycinamide formyltransferase 1 n=1 Tax=Pacificispira spongiicola TaxID=2729598 RepID=A0A7Y0E1P0_9PROT|nr:formyltransferase family protein [Pacificispira spongiicola]NMM45600.1 hypothetical protein [Pacificispira spongiicola]
MRFHLYTTDVSGLTLARNLPGPDSVAAVVVPANRIGSEKVEAVYRDSPWPVLLHKPGELLPETADAFVSWLYSQIISVDQLSRYSKGGLNMHGGRIPAYRGANVLNWAIANGESELGVTWHEVVEEVDAGGILAESAIPIAPDATAIGMRDAMIAEGIRLFPEAVERFLGGGPPVRVPDLSEGTVWPSRRPEHGRIEPGWSLDRVKAMIRAQTGPWPDATVLHEGVWCPVRGVSLSRVAKSVPYTTDDGREIYLLIGENGL